MLRPRHAATLLILAAVPQAACSQLVPPEAASEVAGECDVAMPGWIWCDDFEEDRLGSYFEAVDADGSFVRAPGVGLDGSWGMRARFQAGQVNAGALHLAVGRSPDGPNGYRKSVGPAGVDLRELYWRLYLRNQDGWTGGGGDKLSRATLFHSPDHWGQAMAAHVWSGGPGHQHLVLDPSSGTDEAGVPRTTKYNDSPHTRWLGMARSQTPVFGPSELGRWHCIEAQVRLNDPGLTNGTFRLWIDGRLEAERTGLNWIGSYTGYGINAVFVENYWNDGSPVAQERYIDGFVVSTEPIGCTP